MLSSVGLVSGAGAVSLGAVVANVDFALPQRNDSADRKALLAVASKRLVVVVAQDLQETEVIRAAEVPSFLRLTRKDWDRQNRRNSPQAKRQRGC